MTQGSGSAAHRAVSGPLTVEIKQFQNEPKPQRASVITPNITNNAHITPEGGKTSNIQHNVSSNKPYFHSEHSGLKGVTESLGRMLASVASKAKSTAVNVSSKLFKQSEGDEPKASLKDRIKQKFEPKTETDPLKNEYLEQIPNKSTLDKAKDIFDTAAALVRPRPIGKLRTALTSATLSIVWAASASTSKIPILKQLVFRSEMKGGPAYKIISSEDLKKEGNEEFVTRFQNHSIYPTYPTQPIELSENHKDIFNKLKKEDSSLDEYTTKLNEKFYPPITKQDVLDARMELLKSYTIGTPYKDLSPNARNLFNVINLDLIKLHLKDTNALASVPNNQQLVQMDHLELNYFENEVHDTLARGLAFIDPALLEKETIQVPVKQPNGSFKLVDYGVERFNLSGEKLPPPNGDKIDHDIGHPIFFLTPKNEGDDPPMIVARGTLLADAKGDLDGAKASVEADGRKDISLKWITQNPELAEKMSKVSKDHGAFHVVGHSLGGNIALTLSVAFHSQIERTVAISAPHVSHDVYKEWEKIPTEQRPRVNNLMVEGDLVSGNGDRIIGNAIKVEQQDANGKPDLGNNAIDRHLKPFNNNRVRYAAVDKTKEESKGVRKMATTTTIAMGRFKQSKGFKRKTGMRDAALEILGNNVMENTKIFEEIRKKTKE